MVAITISRQYGSGGRKVALKISEILGWPLFDKRLMMSVASDVGLLPADVVDFTEDDYKVRSFWERLFVPDTRTESPQVYNTFRAVYLPDRSSTFTSDEMDEEGAVLLVNRAIQLAYERGNVIVVGRGGQVLLQDKPDVFHVRIHAPMHVRKSRLVEYEHIPLEESEEIAEKRDKAATRYMRKYFNVDWDDPKLYHLVVNSGKFSTDAIAQLVISNVNQFFAVV